MNAQKKTFSEKAPLINIDELVDFVINEIVDENLRRQASSIWLLGSFVNPGKEIDRGKRRSDLDIFVVVPDWDLPQINSGVALYADQVPTPDILKKTVERSKYAPLMGPDGRWEIPASDIWEELPDSIKKTFVSSIETVFFATQEERESGEIRMYDVIVGDESHLDYNRKKGCPSSHAELPGLSIWQNSKKSL